MQILLAELKNKRVALAYETNRGAIETTIVTILDADDSFIKVMTRPDKAMELGSAITSYIAIKKIDSIIDVHDERIYQKVVSQFAAQQSAQIKAMQEAAKARQQSQNQESLKEKPEMKIVE